MSDSHYYHSSGALQQNRHHSVRPPLVQSQLSVAPRDRYRTTHPSYDAIENDDLYDVGMSLDEFDQRLMQLPYEDRQWAAERGRARLSLAPEPSRFFADTAGLETDRYRMSERHVNGEPVENFRPSVSARLSQFAYNPDQHMEPSSDLQLVPSSSPAFKARQRRTEQQSFDNTQRATEFQTFDGIPPYTAVQRISETPPFHSQREVGRPFQKLNPSRPQHYQEEIAGGAPTVQGIQLIPTSSLPDRLRTVFPFPNFNAVQSKCFDKVFRSDDNFVLSSPTGSGKTAILELAVCRAVTTNATSQYKVVYQAPTKALCSERQRDWEKKFSQVGLKCAELTGDSNVPDLRNVQSADVIITTPEKWDSMTRKWKDHKKLMQLIKLFLIDEVHILKDNRGAVLEAVVSRMKSIGNDVRFVALSATVPNFGDVAKWLGRNAADPQTSAAKEKFGEEFRPVKLKKHVCGYAYNNSNDFAFEKFLNDKLPEVVTKYSDRKPTMVFCATRSSTMSTAKLLANWWGSNSDRYRMWSAPQHTITVSNKDLRVLVSSGVAFHHAGMNLDDRLQVEKGFLDGNINVICCTSTLAVGINLPCYLVIVKNTIGFGNNGPEEYSDLEMMQMLGRAGRPQFDDSAVAVILTRQAKAYRYETLVTGKDVLESRLHLNLIEHLNAEISLGTIRNLPSARRWLTGTFLYTRLKQNPAYYKLEGSRNGQNLEEQVDDICFRDITLLQEHDLVTDEEQFRCTEYGQAMTRYYVPFETMKVFMGLPPKAAISEILSALAQASEFSSIRFRQGEKSLYKAVNKLPQIRFPIPVNLDLPAQKVSLIIQSVLGSADIAWDGDMTKHKYQYQSEVYTIFKSIHGLIRCIIDCQICSGDSVSTHAALMLERSLGSKAWDDSPLQMIQVPSIGIVAARELVNAGIRGIEDLEATDAHRIENLLGRNPPFGLKVLEALKSFPKLRLSLHIQPSSVVKTQHGVKIRIKAEIGFMNEKPPHRFGERFIYVCVLVETSDGRMIHFARISGSKLGTGQSIVFPAQLISLNQSINCYTMCDGIAGSMRSATIKPKIAPSMFAGITSEHEPSYPSNTSKRRTESLEVQRKQAASGDDYGDDEIDDNELMNVSFGDQEFDDIDNYANISEIAARENASKDKLNKEKSRTQPVNTAAEGDSENMPTQLSNGNRACNHRCKDKTACKHPCCRDGVEKPVKKAAKRTTQDKSESQVVSQASTLKEKKMQTKLKLTTTKRKNSHAIEELDLTQPDKKSKCDLEYANPDYRRLEQLHKSVQKNKSTPSTSSVFRERSSRAHDEGRNGLSFMQQPVVQRPQTPSDYGDMRFDDFSPEPNNYQCEPSHSDEIPACAPQMDYSAKAPLTSDTSDTFGDDDSVLGDAMIGLADSQHLASTENFSYNGMQFSEEPTGIDYGMDLHDDDFPMENDSPFDNKAGCSNAEQIDAAALLDREPRRSPSMGDKPSLQPAASMFDEPRPREPQQGKGRDASSTVHHTMSSDSQDISLDVFGTLNQPGKSQAAVKQAAPTTISVREQDLISEVVKQEMVPSAFKDLEPWLFKEFGDIVELEDE